LLHKLVTQESDHDFTDHIVIQHPDHSYLSQISHRKSDLFSSLIDLFNQCKKKHHFVVDYSNGAGVSFEYQFLEHYATKDHRIHHINAFADGSFPAHSSDTLEHQNYNQLIEKIKEQNAEF
jgi:phosphomannomutase